MNVILHTHSIYIRYILSDSFVDLREEHTSRRTISLDYFTPVYPSAMQRARDLRRVDFGENGGGIGYIETDI